MKVSKLSRWYRPEKKPPAKADQGVRATSLAAYQSRAAAPSGPLMLTQSAQGSSYCSARLKFGLLTAKGVRSCASSTAA